MRLYTAFGLSLFRCIGDGDRAPTSREATPEDTLAPPDARLTYKCHTTKISPVRVISLPDLLTRFIGIIISG